MLVKQWTKFCINFVNSIPDTYNLFYIVGLWKCLSQMTDHNGNVDQLCMVLL